MLSGTKHLVSGVRKKTAAHFLLHHELAESPPNTAIIQAYQELGIDVHLYTPRAHLIVRNPPGCTDVFPAEHGYLWIAKNLPNLKWRKYVSISGTTEDPMAMVGLISTLHRIPSFTLADEIKSGSYSGNRSKRWKDLCRRGMRNSQFTIVNDNARIELQRDYCGASVKHPIIVYPGCFHQPPKPGARLQLRRERGIPEHATVLCFSGVSNPGNGSDWLPHILSGNPDLHLWGQFVSLDPMVETLFRYSRAADRIHVETERLPWRDCWSSMAAADIGLVVYTQDGPQFQNMGISSNRLCMFLAMGIPVVARRQPSFEFIEEIGCGVLVENAEEAAEKLGQIVDNYESFKLAAIESTKTHIQAMDRFGNLKNRIAGLIG